MERSQNRRKLLGMFVLLLLAGMAGGTGACGDDESTPETSGLAGRGGKAGESVCEGTPPAGAAGTQDSQECALDDAGSRCEGRASDSQGNANTCVQTIDADLVLAPNCAPLVGFHMDTCDPFMCQDAVSSSTGHVHVPVCSYMSHGAFQVRGTSKYVTYSLPIGQAVSWFGTLVVVPLARGDAELASTTTTSQTYRSGEVTLVLEAGTDVSINTIDYPDPEDRVFRAAVLASAAAPGLAESSPGMELFFGMAPVHATLSKPAALVLPNANHWDAGAAVEFYQQGVRTPGLPYREADWTAAGSGRVSADGKTIGTDSAPSGGITQLALIGARRK